MSVQQSYVVSLIEEIIESFKDPFSTENETKKELMINPSISTKRSGLENKKEEIVLSTLVETKPFEMFFEIKDLYDELVEYLDYKTIDALIKSNISKFSNVQHIFRLYLNEWCLRNQLYGFTQDWVQNQNIMPYVLWDNSKFSIINIKYDDSIDWKATKMNDVLSVLLHDGDYSLFGGNNIFEDIKCFYSTKECKWKYEIVHEWGSYDEIIKYDKETFQSDFVEFSELKYVFNKNEFKSLLSTLGTFREHGYKKIYFNETALNRLINLFDIEDNEHVTSQFVEKWYLHIIECNERGEMFDNKIIFTIFGKINPNIIPKDFIDSYEEHESDPKYDDNTDSFLIFVLSVCDDTQ
eukprot:257820_1